MFLICRRYSVYKALAGLFLDKVILCYCWARVWRDWLRTATGRPELEA